MFSFIKELGKIDVICNYNDANSNEEDDESTFKSYVKSVESDYLLIDFLFYKGVKYNLPLEKQITVNFKRKTGIYSGTCIILGMDNSKLPGIKISFPTEIKFIQQREFVRVPLSLKTEIVFFPDSETEEVKIHEASTLDISGSGFCFVSDEPVKNKSKIVSIINFSDPKEKPVEVSLKYIYSRSFVSAGKERYKNAFAFDEISEKSRDKIIKEIFRYELEMRKKGI